MQVFGAAEKIPSAIQGYLVDWDAQKAVWDRIFSDEVLQVRNVSIFGAHLLSDMRTVEHERYLSLDNRALLQPAQYPRRLRSIRVRGIRISVLSSHYTLLDLYTCDNLVLTYLCSCGHDSSWILIRPSRSPPCGVHACCRLRIQLYSRYSDHERPGCLVRCQTVGFQDPFPSSPSCSQD